MSNTWVKFKLAGVVVGYAHFIGDVVEVSEEEADRLLEASAVTKPKADEIEAAKAKLAALEPAAKTADAPTIDWQAKFNELAAKVDSMLAPPPSATPVAPLPEPPADPAAPPASKPK